MPKNPPNPDKIREEISEFLREKYGSDVAVADVDVNAPHEGVAAHTGTPSIDDIDFQLKPTELEKYLQQFVVHQDSAVEVLATKICTHFHRRRLELENPSSEPAVGQIKSNILMIGPTGVGKTYIVKLIADKIGVPFVKGDATKFSETGYVGGDVDDLIRDLVREADGEIKMAEYGIVYVDEIDKIAASGSMHGPDVSRTGVQRALLKLMEDTEVDLRTPHDLAGQMEAVMETQRKGKASRKKVSTRNILFIVSGAFSDLPEIVSRRLSKGTMGFRGPKEIVTDPQELVRKTNTTDLVEYGFESEFIGRLPVVALLGELNEQGLFDILKNKHSAVVLGKQRDFASYGIELLFEDEALHEIAKRAHRQGIGARGLTAVIESVLIKFEKLLPTSSIRKLVVTREVVENPEAVIKELLTQDSIATFQRQFLEQHGFILEIPAESKQWIRKQLGDHPEKISEKLTEMFKNYEYGIKLTGQQNLQLTVAMLEDPDGYLDRMIKDAYKQKDQEGK